MATANKWNYFTMNGKGDMPRPFSVSKEQFDENWDRIFSKPKQTMLREVNYDNMWRHSCTVDMTVVWLGKNETCDYCGAWEEDEE